MAALVEYVIHMKQDVDPELASQGRHCESHCNVEMQSHRDLSTSNAWAYSGEHVGYKGGALKKAVALCIPKKPLTQYVCSASGSVSDK